MEQSNLITFVVSSDTPVDVLVDKIKSTFSISYSVNRHLPMNRIHHQYTISKYNHDWSNSFEHRKNLENINKDIDDVRLHELIIRHDPEPKYLYFLQDFLAQHLGYPILIQAVGNVIIPKICYYNSGEETTSSIYFPKTDIEVLEDLIESELKDIQGLSVGNDHLIRYFIDRYHPEYKEKLVSIKRDGIYQYVIEWDAIKDENTKELRKRLMEGLHTLQKEGYFPFQENDTKNISVVAELWNNEIVERYSDGLVIGKQKNMNIISDEPERMMRRIIHQINSNSLPLIRLGGPWQMTLSKLSGFYHAQLLYQAVVILRGVPFINCSLDQIIVHRDYSVTVPMTTHTECINFRNTLGSKTELIPKLYAQEVSSEAESFIVRSELSEMFPDILYMSFTIFNRIYVVGERGMLIVTVPSLENKVKAKLVEYHKTQSGSSSEAISMDNFDEMKIEELIQIIKPEAKSPYCVSIETMRKHGKRTSMLTREELSPHVLRLMQQPYLNISGYGQCCYLPGLFPSIPNKYSLDVNLKDDEISFPNDTEMVYQDQIILKPDTIISPEIQTKLREGWKKGHFLTLYDLYICHTQGIPENYNFVLDTETVDNYLDQIEQK